MNTPMRFQPAAPVPVGRRSSLTVSLLVVVLATAARSGAADPLPAEIPNRGRQPAASLTTQLAALHKEARSARESKDFAKVEELRASRLQLIEGAEERTIWTNGMAAIRQADEAVARMDYSRACRLLEAAWKSFADLPPRREVFGDIALNMFLAVEAARMVDPNAAPMPVDEVKAALERALKDDPCQLEVVAALAFLSRPDVMEAFQRQSDRESIGERNGLLLGIARDPNGDEPVVPRHAAVEYLRAKSSSFVLGDMDYLRTFLDPKTRLQGTNRHGQAWCLTLGGGILGLATDRLGGKPRSVVTIDSYDTGRREWRVLRPQVLLVAAAGADDDSGRWQVDPATLAKQFELLLIDLEPELKKYAERQLVAIASRFPPDVVAAVGQILAGTWKNGPPAGSPIDVVLQQAATEFGVYAQNKPEQAAASRKAQDEIQQLIEGLGFVSGIKTQAQNGSLANMLQDPQRTTQKQLQSVVDRMDFPDPRDLEPVAADPLTAAGFGAAAPAVGLSGPQLEAELRDALGRAEVLAAVQAVFIQSQGQIATAGNEARNAVTERERSESEVSPGLRRAASLVQDAVRRLQHVLAKADQANPQPLSLDDLVVLREQLESLAIGSALLELPSLPTLVTSIRTFEEVYDRLVRPVALREAVEKAVAKGRDPVRSWRIRGTDWRFYEFGAMEPATAASWVDGFPLLMLAESELKAVSEHLDRGDGNGPPPAPGVRSGGLATGVLVDGFGASQRLSINMPPLSGGLVAVVLVEQDDGPPAMGPKALVDEQGSYLLLDDAGETRKLRLVTDSGHLVVEFPGLQGHVTLRLTDSPADSPRFIKDERGYRISAAASDQPRLFDIVAANGERVDGSFHSITDLVDLDRNMVNEFLPRALLYAPGFPAWQVYREQLLRQPPDARIRWAVPRPAFRSESNQ
jgi:hypothetical protein